MVTFEKRPEDSLLKLDTVCLSVYEEYINKESKKRILDAHTLIDINYLKEDFKIIYPGAGMNITINTTKVLESLIKNPTHVEFLVECLERALQRKRDKEVK